MEMIDTYLDAPGKIRLKKQEAGRVPIGEIAGHQMRSQPIEVKLAALLAAKAAGVGAILFTRDSFSKYPKRDHLEAVIEERIRQAPSRPTRR